jgi:hypothetical protein
MIKGVKIVTDSMAAAKEVQTPIFSRIRVWGWDKDWNLSGWTHETITANCLIFRLIRQFFSPNRHLAVISEL